MSHSSLNRAETVTGDGRFSGGSLVDTGAAVLAGWLAEYGVAVSPR